jgi:hypothetical protein
MPYADGMLPEFFVYAPKVPPDSFPFSIFPDRLRSVPGWQPKFFHDFSDSRLCISHLLSSFLIRRKKCENQHRRGGRGPGPNMFYSFTFYRHMCPPDPRPPRRPLPPPSHLQNLPSRLLFHFHRVANIEITLSFSSTTFIAKSFQFRTEGSFKSGNILTQIHTLDS